MTDPDDVSRMSLSVGDECRSAAATTYLATGGARYGVSQLASPPKTYHNVILCVPGFSSFTPLTMTIKLASNADRMIFLFSSSSLDILGSSLFCFRAAYQEETQRQTANATMTLKTTTAPNSRGLPPSFSASSPLATNGVRRFRGGTVEDGVVMTLLMMMPKKTTACESNECYRTLSSVGRHLL